MAIELWLKHFKCEPEFDVFETEVAQTKPDLTKPAWQDFKNSLHVIEFSEYERVKKQLELCKEQRDYWVAEKYKDPTIKNREQLNKELEDVK
jgi:hypothetical protein